MPDQQHAATPLELAHALEHRMLGTSVARGGQNIQVEQGWIPEEH